MAKITDRDKLSMLKDVLDEGLAESIDKAITAMDKEAPRLLRFEGDGYSDGQIVYDTAYCPSCDYSFEDGDSNWETAKYCPCCGQRINWNTENAKED